MESRWSTPRLKPPRIVPFAFVLMAAAAWLGLAGGISTAQEPEFTRDFRFEECTFKPSGDNPYFPLTPGRQLILEGEDDGETLRVEITVLRQTKQIQVPLLGLVTTRVVQEREWIDGELVEISRNFFATCDETNDVAYFGETVDIFNEDGTVTHEGQWLAGQPDGRGLAYPGLIMPGTFLLGSRYFQEIADNIALDQATHVETGLTVTTPVGRFQRCVKVDETTPLEPGHVSEKVYCPGIGLIMDDEAKLVHAHRLGQDPDDDEDGDDGEDED